MGEFAANLIVDPNLVYLAFVAGLWVGVTAVYMLGTGIPEIAAFLLLGGSLLVLVQMPTNWLAVLLIIIGLSGFLVLPFVNRRFVYIAELGLVLQAIGGYFMFSGEYAVSPIMIGVTVLVAFAYNRLVLVPMLKTQKERNEFDEAHEVVGYVGRVVKPLDPIGTVYVNKEMWRARSSEPLDTDTQIVVMAVDGLELIVEKAKRDDFIDTASRNVN